LSLLPRTFGTGRRAGAVLEKSALTDLGTFILSLQVPVPAQAPPQPVNSEPRSGVAVSVTDVPSANRCEQLPGHEIPAGVLTTEPKPEPATERLKVAVGEGAPELIAQV
jgi:hypothetical protein